MAAEVLIAVAAARITEAEAASMEAAVEEASMVVVAEAVPMGAAEVDAADLFGNVPERHEKGTRSAGQSHEDFATPAGSERRTQ
jgi:hypothetical protein